MDKEPEIGGCLTYRIPEWRLPAAVRERDLSIIDALGIEVRTGVELGKDLSLAELRAESTMWCCYAGFAGGQELPAAGTGVVDATVRDTIWADPVTCETGIEGLFAGGDAVSGPTSVIDAMAMGRRAADRFADSSMARL